MYRLLLTLTLCAIVPADVTAQSIFKGSMLQLSPPGGWVMTPDGVTLIVSLPDKGQLAYFDTLAEKETKRVDVEFRPTAMALRGNTLLVAAKGASMIYALDLKTGKQLRAIPLGGDAVAHIACHPSKGLVYASTTTLRVYALDPVTGKSRKTSAIGNFLVVDPIKGDALFTGIQPPQDQRELIIKDLPGNRIRLIWDRWGARAFILKFEVQGKYLKLVSAQRNAAVNAYTLAITPDGKKVMMTSGGGWRPPASGGTGGGYVCAAFSTKNLQTRVGEAPSATNMAFHPILKLGVINQSGRKIQLFNPASLIGGESFDVAKGADARPLLITFGGKGTKIILWNGANPANPQEGLHFLRLKLKGNQLAELEKVYGKIKVVTPQIGLNAINLLALIDPEQHARRGKWTLENGKLATEGGVLSIPHDENLDAYELTVRARNKGFDQSNAFGVGLVAGDRRALVKLNAAGGTKSGLENLDGLPILQNETMNPFGLLPPGKEHTIVYRVVNRRMMVSLNGLTVMDWKGDPKRLADPVAVDHNIPARQLYLSAEGPFEITQMELKRLPPKEANQYAPLLRPKLRANGMEFEKAMNTVTKWKRASVGKEFSLPASWRLMLEYQPVTPGKGVPQPFVLFWGDSRPGRDPLFIVQKGSKLHVSVGDAIKGESHNIITEIPPPLRHRWIELDLQFNAEAKKIALYVDGRLVKQQTAVVTPRIDRPMPFFFGCRDGAGGRFGGWVRRVWLGNVNPKDLPAK